MPEPLDNPFETEMQRRSQPANPFEAEMGKRGKVAVSWLGKVKTTLQMVALLLLLAFAPGTQLSLLGVLTLHAAAIMTLWSMVMYLRAAWPHLSRAM